MQYTPTHGPRHVHAAPTRGRSVRVERPRCTTAIASKGRTQRSTTQCGHGWRVPWRLWAATTLQRKMALRGWQDEAGGVAAGRVGGAAGRRGELHRVSCRCKKTITAIVLPRSACAWVSLCAPARQHRCEGSLAGPATHKQGSHARCSGDLRTYSWDIPGCVRICVGMYAGCAWDVHRMYAGCTRDARGICVRSRVRCA